MKWDSKTVKIRPQSLIAYRLRDNYLVSFSGYIHKKGSIFVKVGEDTHSKYGWIKLATFTDSYTLGGWSNFVNNLFSKNLLEMINLEDYPELYPHYPKRLVKLLCQ